MQTTIGGDRLGSGNKQTVSFRNYERSTHDLSHVWKSSMASGTLVPFLCQVALPGDKWEIDLNAEVLTLPTIGPLFGSYKVQLDIFEIPIRIYNAMLHNNALGIGMNMKQVQLPQIQVLSVNKIALGELPTYKDNEQINASCILKYLGISGLGTYTNATPAPLERLFNAVPLLAYWDIYKNYYSNKQEEIGVCIHTDQTTYQESQKPLSALAYDENFNEIGQCLQPTTQDIPVGGYIWIEYPGTAIQPNLSEFTVNVGGTEKNVYEEFETLSWDEAGKMLYLEKAITGGVTYIYDRATAPARPSEFFGIVEFPLDNIDAMRDNILRHALQTPLTITTNSLMPYSAPMKLVTAANLDTAYACTFSQEGLGIKTYQSDLLNNWISTEWIDGAEGISALTAVDTSEGSFTIDALNIASKVYDMLNRIAISGGTYDDWLEAVYTHERVKAPESPVYCGSLIKELAFEEVISTAQTIDDQNRKQPLGTLAGRGRLTGKHKGGRVEITVNEPSYILGICSLTPRLDYSQGNSWDVNLKTLDDLHKPALDGIGFQDLITEQMLWSDTVIDNAGTVVQYSAGKQPAWINYMTAINKNYGSFAEPEDSMFMTLNRRYDKNAKTAGRIQDMTTYIDPSKYNYIFADTSLSSQNFWVQIAMGITTRRKMSAKIIPNL